MIEGVLLGLMLSVMAGPVFFLLLDTTMEYGKRAAVVTDAGILFSDACYIMLFAFGAADLLMPLMESPWSWLVGGFVFIGFGLTYIFKKRTPKSSIAKTAIGLGFVKGFLANTLNPSVLAFWFTTVALALSEHPEGPHDVLYLFGATLATVALVDIGKIFGADWLRQHLSMGIMVWVSRIAGGLFIAIGAGFVIRFFTQ